MQTDHYCKQGWLSSLPIGLLHPMKMYSKNIPTALTLNDEPFEISFGLDSETGYFQMILNRKLVKLLDDYGIHSTECLDQWLADVYDQ